MSDRSTSINVRTATPAHLDTIVAFNSAMALETEGIELDVDRLRRGVSAVLEDPALGRYFIAEIGGHTEAESGRRRDWKVVGQLMITYEWSDWRNGRFWWIQSVYVHPNHRRRGVYRALDAHVRAEAMRDGSVCGLRLYVDRDNHVAQSVYASLDMQHSHYDLYEIDFVL